METITKYRTSDGCEFTERGDAERRDDLIRKVGIAMNGLPPIPASGRVHVDEVAAAKAKQRITALCRELFPQESVFKDDAACINPCGHAGRFLDECGIPAIYKAWHWFMCQKGEWLYEQPFYAINPKEFKE